MTAWFPNDPSLCLILIDQHVLRGEYAEALACVETLRKAVGGDAYLDYVSGCIYQAAKQFGQAKAADESAIAAEPTLAKPYWGLVGIALEQKDWPSVSRGLTRIEQNLPIKITNLEAMDAYAEYVKTEEYRKWKSSR
jgi:tetratricopeptide (TPR) repeat protein